MFPLRSAHFRLGHTVVGVASASWENEIADLRTLAATNDLVAISVAVVSLGQLALESFVAGASLLVGLFFYDAISVFKSDAMMTVATKVWCVVCEWCGVCACPAARRPITVTANCWSRHISQTHHPYL